jgi:uncharacterized DUF497 family protein
MKSAGFEWDDEKARINTIQHNGVTFEDARLVFDEDLPSAAKITARTMAKRASFRSVWQAADC